MLVTLTRWIPCALILTLQRAFARGGLMNKIGTMRIEQVIGPRLELGGIVVIETQTTSGRVALELSLPVLECLDRALRTAMAAGAILAAVETAPSKVNAEFGPVRSSDPSNGFANAALGSDGRGWSWGLPSSLPPGRGDTRLIR